MTKFNISAIVLASMFATAAFAADVKVGGTLDAAFGSFQQAHQISEKSRATAVESGILSPSLLSIRGQEDLGGGLKVGAVLESYLAADTGAQFQNAAGGIWSRTSSVSLASENYQLTLGQAPSAIYLSSAYMSAMGESIWLSPTIRNMYGSAGILSSDTSWQNSLTLARIGDDFQAAVQVAAGESAQANRDSYAATVWKQIGPVDASIAYASLADQGVGHPTQAEQRVWSAGVHTNLGPYDFYGQYSDVNGGAHKKSYEVGAKFKVTEAGTLSIATGRAWADVGSQSLTTVAWTQSLSKRTALYAAATRQEVTSMASGNTVAMGINQKF